MTSDTRSYIVDGQYYMPRVLSLIHIYGTSIHFGWCCFPWVRSLHLAMALQAFWNLCPHPSLAGCGSAHRYLDGNFSFLYAGLPLWLISPPPGHFAFTATKLFLVFRRQAGLGTLPLPQDPTLASPRTMHRQVTPVWEHDLSSRACVALSERSLDVEMGFLLAASPHC